MTPGAALPPLEVPVTRTLIVAGALASRDFQDVHHDAEAARSQGAKDVFMNILTTNGLVSRYVTDWAPSGAVVQGIALRLGVPNYPGDTMRMTGAVTELDGGVASIEVRGANSLGDHVVATVRVRLP